MSRKVDRNFVHAKFRIPLIYPDSPRLYLRRA